MKENSLKFVGNSLFNKDSNIKLNHEDYAFLCNQTIQFLGANNLSKCVEDKELIKEWKNHTINQIRHYHLMLNELNDLTTLLTNNGMIPIILKGFSSAMYYPNPEYRCLGDIDFILADNSEDMYAKAREILKDNGYKEKTEKDRQRHIEYFKNGIEFEMHSYFSIGGRELDKKEDEHLNNCDYVKREINDISFYSYNDIDNGIVLLGHIRHHLYSGLGFRQIIDWIMYAYRVLDDENYKVFKKTSSELGLEKLGRYIYRLGEIYFNAPHLNWVKDVDDKAVKELYELIIKAGNFGKNLDRKSKDVVLALNYKMSFKELQRRGESNLINDENTFFPKKLAFLYEIWRYIRLGIFERKGAIRNFIKDYKNHRKQKALFEELGIR